MRPIKLFSEFLTPPRTILSLPLIGQISASQLIVSTAIAILSGAIGKALGGLLLWLIGIAGGFLCTLLLLQREHDHVPMSERVLAALRFVYRRRVRPESLRFIPQDDAPITADSLTTLITLDTTRRGRVLRQSRRGGSG